MGVYIKGMEMPPNCCQCPVNMEVCKRGYEYLLKHPELYDKRADDCPIVEIPPHGRLIDADALMENEENISFKDEWHMTVTEAFVSVKNIAHAPTIIEAEGEET